MFAGIVETVSSIQDIREADKVRQVRITLPPRWKLKKGESVAVNGICTTVVSSSARSFSIELMPETLRKTTGSSWKKGVSVNLERSLKYGDRVSGQLLPGHVDGTAVVHEIRKDGASKLVTLALPKALAKNIGLHGWITVDGVSLTVAKKAALRATVALVPYTLSVTTLEGLKKGSVVNVETDRTAHATVPAHASPARRRTSARRLAS